MAETTFTIRLANPRGFCAGVERAIDIVERALEKYGAPVYVRHEIVHNKRVVSTLRDKGAVFVDTLAEIPDGAVTIFSAHGVSHAVVNRAKERDLPVIDATCPLVSKVHKEGQNHVKKGREVVLIGHEGHPEVEGTKGSIPGTVHVVETPEEVAALTVKDPGALAYVTQTTLSVDDTRDVISALKDRFPAIEGPDVKDICYATQNRQQAARALAADVDVMLVVGAKNSSNSNRLREIGTEMAVPSHLIDDADAIDHAWMNGITKIGVTAGASAPEELVDEVIARLHTLASDNGFDHVAVEPLSGVEENMHFKLPRELSAAE